MGDMNYRDGDLKKSKKYSRTSLVLSLIGILVTIIVAVVLLLTNTWTKITGAGH